MGLKSGHFALAAKPINQTAEWLGRDYEKHDFEKQVIGELKLPDLAAFGDRHVVLKFWKWINIFLNKLID